MKRSQTAVLIATLVLASCGSAGGSDGDATESDGRGSRAATTRCETPTELVRRTDVPVGVLMPSGAPHRQSYASIDELVTVGYTAVSLGFPFYYSSTGEIVYDFDGNADADARQRWEDEIRCTVIEAKEAGLVVAVWGQFIEAGVRGEPGKMNAGVQNAVLDGALALMPEVAALLEELKVEYWSPVSELDKFAGPTGHNEYFAQMVDAGRAAFSGTIYAQPNILDRNGFVAQSIVPEFGEADALGISWISYECEADRMPPGQSLAWADYFVDAAAAQGVSRVFISELGDTRPADESQRPCLNTLIDYWDGMNTGVFLLDMPTDQPGTVRIKDSWQEAVLQERLG